MSATQMITAASGGTLKDATGNTWTLTSAGVVDEDATPVPDGSGTSALAIVGNVIYGQDATSQSWYTYSTTDQFWTSSAAPALPPAPTPAPAPAPTTSELTPTSGGTVTDEAGNAWTLTSAGVVDENGTAVPGGSGTSALAIVGSAIYGQDAASHSWYTYSTTDQFWSSSAAPILTSTPVPAPIPTPAPTPTPTPVTTNDGTVYINLSAPVTWTGGADQLLMGFPFGGGGQQTLSSNGEGEVYEPSGITQNPDGSVTLTAQPNPNTNAAWPNDLPYTSGAFSTAGFVNSEPQAGGFQALYGYFQMTAELPTGAGLWPAFWLEPTDGVSASEIDVMEAPFNNPTLIQASLHDNVGGYTTGPVTVPNFSTNYNTYGVNWNAQTITYYVNGQVIGSTPTPASANTAHYILANLAVGGQSWSWPGTPNASNTWPASMTIKNITYNPNGPNGVGNDGGTYSGGLVTTSPTTSGGSATSAMVAQSQISDAATSGTTMQLLKGAGAGVSSSSGGQTYVIPAAGNGVEAFTSNILALGDTLNLTTALAATNWNGSTSTLSNYLKVTDSTQAATLSISATSGGSGVAIATIDGATTATLSSLLAHSIT